jgi:hypothetical protein
MGRLRVRSLALTRKRAEPPRFAGSARGGFGSKFEVALAHSNLHFSSMATIRAASLHFALGLGAVIKWPIYVGSSRPLGDLEDRPVNEHEALKEDFRPKGAGFAVNHRSRTRLRTRQFDVQRRAAW